MPEELTLRLPRLEEEQEFLLAHRATTPEQPSFLHDYEEGISFARYLELLDERARGLGLVSDQVPATFLFAFVGRRIVGRVSIRHRLNAKLERLGGHIGYVVVPEFRRRGYASAILRQALQLASELGLRRALLTCADDNRGSIKVIERNGGVLENVITDADLATPKRRYWIRLAP